MTVQKIYNRYAENGYVFSDEIITRYALSLLTKQFVILSGISGTGKTKIAQLFDVEAQKGGAAKQELEDGFFYLTVTENMRTGSDARNNFKFSYFDYLFEEDEKSVIRSSIIKKVEEGDNGNICEDIDFTINTLDKKKITIAVYLQRASSPLLRYRARRAKGDAKFDSRYYFKENFKAGDVLKISKTGKNELQIDECIRKDTAQEYIEYSGDPVNNKCFISVKSNWTDPTEFIGYYNPLKEKYVMSKALKFILTAADNPNTPFFLILDEMNLAKVEHYFSDFLSCLESRGVDSDGNTTQEPISIYAGSEIVKTDDEIYSEISTSVVIPENFYITGTVNIDDTTHMFSSKVLDRANTIEFNDVYISIPPKDTGYKLKKLPNFTSYTKSNFKMFNELNEDSKKLIEDLHASLKINNLHFGYRTISEISHYINNAISNIDDSIEVIEKSLDIQILQKILPKLHGSYAQLHEPLENLLAILISGNIKNKSISIKMLDELNVNEEKYSLSVGKLISLYKNLTNKGYASFIE